MPVNKIRRNGSYAPLSAHYYKDDRIAEAGLAAELLYVRSLAFCSDVLNDGSISETQLIRFVGVGMKDARKRAARLVEVGLWIRDESGYRIASWLKWNRSRDEIGEMAKKDSERKMSGAQEGKVQPDSERNSTRHNGNFPVTTAKNRGQSGVSGHLAGIFPTDQGDPGTPDAGDPRIADQQEQSELRTESVPGPTGFQPRARSPRNSSKDNTSGVAAVAADNATSTIHPGFIVGAWTEAFEGNGTKPSASMKGQVGRLAAELITAGNDPAKVLAAAQAAGTKGFATIDRELGALNGRRLKAVGGDEEWRKFSEQ